MSTVNDTIENLENLLDQSVQLPWFWRGNADYHNEGIAGRVPGHGVVEVLTTTSITRQSDSREAQMYRADLRECFQDEDRIEAEMERWLTDEDGYSRADERLCLTGDDHMLVPVSDVPVFEVGRNQKLPDDTPRSDPRIYRADIVDVNNTNGRLLVAAVNALPELIARIRDLEAQLETARSSAAMAGSPTNYLV